VDADAVAAEAEAEVVAQVRAWAANWPRDPSRPRVLTLPPILASGRLRVRRSAVMGLAAIVVVTGVFFSVRVALAARSAEPQPVAPGRGALVSRSVPSALAAVVTAGPGQQAQGQAGAADTDKLVHVVGEVAKPGVVRVTSGARVIDAITAAGGALPTADLKRVNLARLVLDAEQIHVPAPGELLVPGAFGSTQASPSVLPSGAGPAGVALSGRVNLNTADLAALDTLPGVGPVLAQRIIDWRIEHGSFASVDELGEVGGIGEKLLAQLTPKVSV
ncbi:MAG: helix-hairpin-helix domain-containing protein, partial [Candidatus Phosphoribacter sp.]